MKEVNLEEIKKIIQETRKNKSFLLWTPQQYKTLLESTNGKKDGK